MHQCPALWMDKAALRALGPGDKEETLTLLRGARPTGDLGSRRRDETSDVWRESCFHLEFCPWSSQPSAVPVGKVFKKFSSDIPLTGKLLEDVLQQN